ncbi:MAG: hypothetical protein KAS75_03270 [Planctomycetes bacterium]|nr:hypothetical protein [Planctomycetota bacterium]
MSIAFHCEHCNKKIQAPDNAGSKWGKCPSCHNKVYVPSPPDSDEQLTLAPIDKNEKAKQKELIAETRKLTQDILSESEPADDSGGVKPPSFEIDDKEMLKNILVYLRQMVNGDLEQAKISLDAIVNRSVQATKIVDEIAISEMPEPELADIPQQVLSGLIRDLRSKIH